MVAVEFTNEGSIIVDGEQSGLGGAAGSISLCLL